MPGRPVMRVADKDKEPRVNCMIGEKIWSDRSVPRARLNDKGTPPANETICLGLLPGRI